MRSLLLVLVLCGAAWGQQSLGPILGGLLQTRVYAHGTRIANMENSVSRLEARVDEAIATGRDVYVNQLNNLAFRVGNIEGTGCPEGQFQCGDDLHHCIEEVLVCDGRADCRNGFDEGAGVCTNPVPAGSSFYGQIHFSSCATLPDFEMRLFITGTRTFEYFTASTTVRATLVSSGKDGNDMSFATQGAYNYGSRTLTLSDPSNTSPAFAGLELSCTFTAHDSDTANCQLLEVFTRLECAKLRLTRA